MTDSRPDDRAPFGRRRLFVVAAAVVVLVLVAGVIAVSAYDRRYGPPEPGNFGGILTPAALTDDGGNVHHFKDRTGSVMLLESMANPGAHSIKAMAIEDHEVVAVSWSVFVPVDGGNVSGADTAWQALPAVIPAHGLIRLRVTVDRPQYCGAIGSPSTTGMGVYSGSLLVRWQSLLRSHTTVVDSGSETITC